MVMTPDGKAVAFIPSLVGRAPEPPELKVRTSALTASGEAVLSVRGRIDSWKLHKQPAPSAGTVFGNNWSSAS